MVDINVHVNHGSTYSKINQSQGWGTTPSHRQLLGYDKGARMLSLFSPSNLYSKTSIKVALLIVSKKILGGFFVQTPLCKMLKLEEKNKVKIMVTESLVEIIQVTEKNTFEESDIRNIYASIFE